MSQMIDQLIPFIRVQKINRTIDSKIQELENIDLKLDKNEVEDIDHIKSSLKKNIEYNEERKRSVEDKAKSIIFTITVALSFIIGSIQLFDVVIESNLMGWIVTVFLVLGILLLIVAGIVVINAMNIGKYYIPLYYDNYDIIENNVVLQPTENDIDVLKGLIKSNKINEKIIAKKLNLVYSGFMTIRNGVICLAAFFLLVVLNFMIENNDDITTNVDIRDDKVSSQSLIMDDTVQVQVPVSYEVKVSVEDTVKEEN